MELQSLEPRLALAVADTIAPTVKSIAAPSANTYAAGNTLSFKATFTEKVVVTGVPTLPITIGDTVRQATWNGKGSGGNSLVFTTTVQAGDLAPSGVSIAGPIGLSGATIRDKAGNALIPAATGTFPKAKVDAVGPSVTAFGTATITPKLVSVPVTFSEPVTIKGKPSIPFTLAGVSKQLVYQGGSGKNVLTFTYKPAKGEAPTAVNVNVPTQAIGLNGGAIADKVRNAAASLAKPTDVQLAATGIPENQPSGTVVSTLSAVDSDGSRDRHTFSLVAGAGSTDNASFQIVGNQLRTTGPFDFETKASYAVRVRTTDAGGLFIEKAFTITVTNVNETPTDIALSGAIVAENQSSGTTVGTFTTTDPDAGNTFTYTLVSGAGSTNNASFQIVGNQLRTTGPFDFETKASYVVRVRTTDAGGLFTEKAFTITVTNVDDVVVQFVRVGDAGNAADTNPAGYGAVSYEYRIGTYEITIGQYTKFLNAVAKTDRYRLYHTFMGNDTNIAGISRSGSTGSYTYAVMNNGGDSSNRPITYVSWFDAARFANWIHNGQPAGSQNATTTEDGAYTLNGATSGTALTKNAGARFYIPTENEWYKAAYYKGGSTNAGYWDYATKSDSAPGNTIGSGANQANYYAGDFAVTQSTGLPESQNYLTNVGAFTNSASYYGTFDQSGNVYQWNDLDGTAGSSRGLRGGFWGGDAFDLSSSGRYTYAPSLEDGLIGFRLASPV